MKASKLQSAIVIIAAFAAALLGAKQLLNLEQPVRLAAAAAFLVLASVNVGVLLSLPGTALGLLLIPWYGFGRPRWSGRALEITARRQLIGGKWVGAQTHGVLIFYRSEHDRSYEPLRAHEHVHVEQGRKLGPVYMALYVAHYCYNRISMDHYEAYRCIYFEMQARKISGH